MVGTGFAEILLRYVYVLLRYFLAHAILSLISNTFEIGLPPKGDSLLILTLCAIPGQRHSDAEHRSEVVKLFESFFTWLEAEASGLHSECGHSERV